MLVVHAPVYQSFSLTPERGPDPIWKPETQFIWNVVKLEDYNTIFEQFKRNIDELERLQNEIKDWRHRWEQQQERADRAEEKLAERGKA